MDTKTPKGIATLDALEGIHGCPDLSLPVHPPHLRFYLAAFS